MEEKHPKSTETTIGGTHFPLPWLWEEGYMFIASCQDNNGTGVTSVSKAIWCQLACGWLICGRHCFSLCFYWFEKSGIYGCFQKWWYPQIINFNRVFHYKPSILRCYYFWKHPYTWYTWNPSDPCFGWSGKGLVLADWPSTNRGHWQASKIQLVSPDSRNFFILTRESILVSNTLTRWWFPIFFIFTPNLGEMIYIIWLYTDGLKPPTS